jgi:manganese efflux pump family protein
MSIAALITWLITAGFGSFMLRLWISHGGLRRSARGASHFPPARVFSHLGLAVAGLIVWIVYLVTDNKILAWIAVADLVLVALLGLLLVLRWASDGRAAMRGDRRADPAAVDLAEQHIPRLPVVLHGIFAVSTLILVLLTALGIGES